MPHPTVRVALTSLLIGTVAVAFAACTSGGVATPAASVGANPSPAESMAETPSPSESMVEHSPAASVAAPVSSGSFHAVDGTASGTAALFHRPDGSFVITFEGFSTPTASHVHVVLVPNTDVTKDSDVNPGTLVDLGPLTGTTGMQDYAVPASADAMALHTVVLWDTEMTHAIAAAPLAAQR